MNIDFMQPSSSTAMRVICGELSVGNKCRVHGEAVFALISEGSAEIEIENEIHSVKTGDLCFIAPNRKYRIDNSGGVKIECAMLNLNDSAAVTQEFVPNSLIRGMIAGSCTGFAVLSPKDKCYASALGAFEAVIEAESEKPEYFELLVHGKMYELFYTFFSSNRLKVYDVETQSKKYRALRRVTEYINENFCSEISLDSVAAATGLSRYYVSHLFNEIMNTTFVNYLGELRLTRAATLISTTEAPIVEIAVSSGFNNISNFNRAFKARYKTTPSKYRRNGGAIDSGN